MSAMLCARAVARLPKLLVVRLGELQAELNDLKAKKEAMEDEWLELAEALGVE